MVGTTVGDGDLVRATLEGGDDAFGTLIERHLETVFEAAWHVARDRWVAADVTSETFEYAWQTLDELPPDEIADVLVDMAERRALYLQHIASGGVDEPPVPDEPEPDTPPAIGPVLTSRVVSALEAKGVPVPAESTGSHRALHLKDSMSEPTNLWLPAAVIAVLLVGLVTAFVGIGMGGSDGDGVGTGESASGAPSDTAPSTTGRDSTSSTAAQTTTSEDTTTSSSTTTTEPDDTTTTAPAETTTTAPPSPGSTAAVDFDDASADPVIYNFGGTLTGRNCGGGDVEVRLWWDSDHGESARLQADGGESISVPLDGSHVDCAERGTAWTLTIRNGGDTESRTITVG